MWYRERSCWQGQRSRANDSFAPGRAPCAHESAVPRAFGELPGGGGHAAPTKRLKATVKRDARCARISLNGPRDIAQRLRLGATRPSPPPNCAMKPTPRAAPSASLCSPHCGASEPAAHPHLGGRLIARSVGRPAGSHSRLQPC